MEEEEDARKRERDRDARKAELCMRCEIVVAWAWGGIRQMQTHVFSNIKSRKDKLLQQLQLHPRALQRKNAL
jgi:hypothetical protein